MAPNFQGTLTRILLLVLPQNYGERLLAQIVGAVAMIGISVTGTFLMYFLLYIIPIKPFIWLFERLCCLNPRKRLPPLRYVGGWLLTHPDEEFQMQDMPQLHARLPSESDSESPNMSIARKSNTKVQVRYMYMFVPRPSLTTFFSQPWKKKAVREGLGTRLYMYCVWGTVCIFHMSTSARSLPLGKRSLALC